MTAVALVAIFKIFMLILFYNFSIYAPLFLHLLASKIVFLLHMFYLRALLEKGDLRHASLGNVLLKMNIGRIDDSLHFDDVGPHLTRANLVLPSISHL